MATPTNIVTAAADSGNPAPVGGTGTSEVARDPPPDPSRGRTARSRYRLGYEAVSHQVTGGPWSLGPLSVARLFPPGGQTVPQRTKSVKRFASRRTREQPNQRTPATRSAWLWTASDAAWVANQLPHMIEKNQEAMRVEQALRSVMIALSDGLETAPSVAAAPAPTPTPSPS
jgi:hypothetical protein